MKKLKNNLLLIVALLVTAATVSAFTMVDSKPESPAAVETTWYFTGTQSQILDVEYWRNTGSTPLDCSSSGNSPCSIAVPAADETELEEFFDGKNAGEITAMSEDNRP